MGVSFFWISILKAEQFKILLPAAFMLGFMIPIVDGPFMAILQSIDSKLAQLQDVSETVKEIQRHLSAGAVPAPQRGRQVLAQADLDINKT